ncbi:hypothetical protein PFLG_02687 [Plasmodium falciparum RAJ116]|uniref:Uncharacterized protein n=1 Tax=Plasmodium falciparum RAJ116 TaxID=580058 RepID=A0A0L0D243_PLAFA|nr:hypothetical protein PFLG_02687 [Plasmodium falciparum RAJ116]
MNDDSHDNHNNHNNNSVYYLHMNKLNNVINYMLLYDKECCANFNDILNLFRNDVERIFCESTSLSYKKKVEYKEIINDIFLKYFDKHITYKTNDLFINIYNNKLYKLENKNDIYENDHNLLSINNLKQYFFFPSKDENIRKDFFLYKTLVDHILTINTYLLLKRTNILFVNHQSVLINKIVTIFCYYKYYHLYFLKGHIEEIKQEIKRAYEKAIKMFNVNKQKINKKKIKDDINNKIEDDINNKIEGDNKNKIEDDINNKIEDDINNKIEDDINNKIEDDINNKIEGDNKNKIEDDINNKIEDNINNKIDDDIINKIEDNINNKIVDDYYNDTQHTRNVFLSEIFEDEEYLNLLDNVIYNGGIDILYESFINEYYLYILHIIKHKDIIIEGNF